MDWYEPEVRGLEAAVAANPPPAGVVAFYGSSSIRLWGTLAADFPGRPVVNLGFGGSTLDACAHFFDRLVPPCRPAAVVLYAGDNDLGDGRSPEQVADAFRRVADGVQRLAARLVFLSVKPSPARWHLRDRIDRANRLVRDDLHARPGGGYLDVGPPMLGPDGRPRPDLFSDDGLHLSPAGYRLWADLVRRESGLFA